MNKIRDFVSNLKQKPFIKSLINDLNSDIYAVGGVVRDLILNKPNKDIDLIVRKVPIDTLISFLQKFGKVDVVGKSFGVIKFIDSDGVDYDIALPRQEQKNDEGGYRGFDVQSDENLPIETDLGRRDAKMNAMAVNINTGKFIDPLGGLNDIENKQISAANPNAFSDDPLRMLRIIAFASRFNFTIEPQTMQMIQSNAERITEISPERILTEFEKIVNKGNKSTGAFLLKQTGLLKQIFTRDAGIIISNDIWDRVKTMGEFIYLLSHNLVENPAEYYKNTLKGDLDTYKLIKALSMAFDSTETTNIIEARSIAHNMYVTSPQSLQSEILSENIKNAAQDLLQGKYPKTIGELAINGNDLMQAGLKGKAIGDAQKSLLIKVYADNVKNNKEDLLSALNDKNINNEGVADTYGEKFGIPNTAKQMDDRATANIINSENEIVGYTDETPIIKNPKSLTNFSRNVRAIGSSNGDLYVMQGDAFVVHGEMAQASGLFKYEDEIYNNQDKYILMHRVGDSNDFGLSDSYEHYLRIETRLITANKIINALKKKNPQYNFYLEFYTKVPYIRKGTSLDEYTYQQLSPTQPSEHIWVVNNENVNIDFFVDKYYVWNQGAYDSVSSNSVLEFLQNNYEDLITDEILKKELYRELTDREILDENEQIRKVAYSAVVLDDISKNKLIKVFNKMIPEGWEIIAHHMTINLGVINSKYADDLGKSINLSVENYAIDDKVMAVGVSGYPSINIKPHITLAVNRKDGGKPMMSNKLTNWRPLGFPLKLTGIVTEVI
jgi:hypothetical protein